MSIPVHTWTPTWDGLMDQNSTIQAMGGGQTLQAQVTFRPSLMGQIIWTLGITKFNQAFCANMTATMVSGIVATYLVETLPIAIWYWLTNFSPDQVLAIECHDSGKVITEGFTEIYGNFYQLIEDKQGMNNREAVLECRRFGGRLAEITARHEFEVLQAFMKTSKITILVVDWPITMF